MNDEANFELILKLDLIRSYFAVKEAAIQIGEGADPPYIELALTTAEPLSAIWVPADEIALDLILVPTLLGIGKIELVGERASDARLVTRVRLTATNESFRPMVLEWWRRIRESLSDHIRREPEQRDKSEELEQEWWVTMVDREDVDFIRDWQIHSVAELAKVYTELTRASIYSRAYRLRKKYKARHGKERGEEIVPKKI